MDLVMCQIRAPSGEGNYLLEIRQFLWNHRSENETDLVIISGKESMEVHEAVILPMSDHPIDVLPPSCPCTKPAIWLPPFPNHILTAAVEILYIGKATGVTSQEELVKIKEVFSFLKVKGDIIADFEGVCINGDHDPEVAAGGAIVKIELTDEENNNSIISQDNHSCSINDVKGFINNDSLRNTTEMDKYVKEEPTSPYSEEPVAKLKPMKRKAKEAKCGNQKRDKKSSEEQSYSCNHCEYKCKFKYNVAKHIQQVHNNERRFMCDLCGKTFQSKSCLRDHMEKIHEKKEIMCDDCDRTFFSKINLRRHKRRVHTSERPFMCELCAKKYKNKISLDNHKEIVHERNEITCDDCGRLFLSKMNLRRHKKNIHNEVNSQKRNVSNSFSCDECDRKFPCKSKLNLHVQIQHQGILPFACDQCDKKHKFSVSLKNHKLVHSGMATFNCNHCTGKFISKRTLVRHLNDSHTIQTYKKYFRHRPKTHMCQVCSKCFRGISELERHKVVHTGERNHICHICNRAFSQKKQMKEHVNHHLAGNLDSNGFKINK